MGITNGKCNELYKGKLGGTGITDQMLCATRTIQGVTYGSCEGDSGGPIVNPADGKQVGVVSFGSDNCENPKEPGVYARVSSVIDWIHVYMDDWYHPCTSDADCDSSSQQLDCFIGTCNQSSGICDFQPESNKGIDYQLQFMTDDYPSDSSWQIFDLTTTTHFFFLTQSDYIHNNTLYEHNFTLCKYIEHALCVHDSNGDGI